MTEREKSELEFQEYLDSISFIDDKGKEVALPVTEDMSEDPEGDRTMQKA